MRITYDDDATHFATWMKQKLSQAGLLESAIDCDNILRQFENYSSVSEFANELNPEKDYIYASRQILQSLDEKESRRFERRARGNPLLRDPPPYIFKFLNIFSFETDSDEAFASYIVSLFGESAWRSFRLAYLEAASVLDERECKSVVPLNVIAVISVLHRLIVVPKLNYDDLRKRMQRIVEVEDVIIGDDSAVEAAPITGETLKLGTSEFWNLFKSFEVEFAGELNDSAQGGGAESSRLRGKYESPEELVNARIREVASRVMEGIRQDRGET